MSRVMGGEPSFVPYLSDLAAPSLYVCSPADLSSPWTPTEFIFIFPCTSGAHLYCVWRGPGGSVPALQPLPRQQRRDTALGMAGDTSKPPKGSQGGGQVGSKQYRGTHEGFWENGLTGGETPAPLESVPLPALPSGMHRMLFVCLFGCFVCLFSYAIKEKAV